MFHTTWEFTRPKPGSNLKFTEPTSNRYQNSTRT